AATRPAAAAPAAAEPDNRAGDRADEKPAADKPTRGGKPNTFSAAQRDVTTSQALSTDPGGSVQQQALTLVNENRRRGGCDNLTVDRRLIVAANRHAAEMARRGYFAHEDSRGRRAGDRVEDAGYQWSRYGENIARGQDSVAEVVDGWMKSPEHRENIMDCGLREVGVGLAFSADRTPYWVQDFATPQ
ncbi:CAP domain-containing protein, partial [Actinoplanes sp. NPDC004185]